MDLNQDSNVATGLETMVQSLCLLSSPQNVRGYLPLSQMHPAYGMSCQRTAMVQQYVSAPPQKRRKLWHSAPGAVYLSRTQSRQQKISLVNFNSTRSKRQHSLAKAQSISPTPAKSMLQQCSGLSRLKQHLYNNTFFTLPQDEMLKTLGRAFRKELRYLKHAYAIAYPAGLSPSSSSPSRILYPKSEGYPEIDRTLNGILALRWLYLNDYTSFTYNQSSQKLSLESFHNLREFFASTLENFQNHDALFTLIVMQMTNDLGKSSTLLADIQAITKTTSETNHDAIMEKVVTATDHLIPSLQTLDLTWQLMVKKLIKLSASYNPAQLIQGECQSVALQILTTGYTEFELNMKFAELFLDLSGAAGHVNHEGAKTMTQPTFQGMMKAREICIEVARGELSTETAYEEMLKFRLVLLEGYQAIEITDEWYAIARLLSMGRVATADAADLYVDVFRSLEKSVQQRLITNLVLSKPTSDGKMLHGIQPTYFPSLLALVSGGHDGKFAMLKALFTFLADVMQADLGQISVGTKSFELKDVLIAERDVRHVARMVKTGDVGFLYNNESMPQVQIAKTI